MEPNERIKRFGIECVGPYGDGILFAASTWKPGGEYVQKLIVRNVTTSVKKLKYKLPSTRYFSLAYPEVIILSPGMFKELDVVFRPVVYDPYDDFILFIMQDGDGSFRVPVRALISKLQIRVPYGVELGFCPTHQITRHIFQLQNTGEIDAPFRWDTPYPFQLKPSQGVIPVGQSQDIEVTIFPEDASVYVSQVNCYIGEGVHAIIPDPIITTRITAIAKYTYIVLSDPKVEFGEVLSGTSPDVIAKEIILRNPTVVPAEFQCLRFDNDCEEVFHITPRSGVVPTQGEITIKVSYSPLAFGVFSQDKYIFQTPSKSSTTLTLSGTSMPPKITLEKEVLPEFSVGSPINSINFRDTEVNNVESRLFFLKNSSNLTVPFTVLCDDEAIFKVTPVQGHIPALMEVPIKIYFQPTNPINYYRRIFVLIGDALPLFVDFMGTGFIRAKGEIKEQRPAPLRHAHVQAYRNRCVAGYDAQNPDELDELHQSRPDLRNLFALIGLQGTLPLSVTLLKNPLTRTGEASRVDLAVAQELFIDDTEALCRGVVLDTTELDFGYTSHHTVSQARIITVTNKTNGKVMLKWFPPRVSSEGHTEGSAIDEQFSAPVFTVEPEVSEISAGSSMKYKVTFHPYQSNRNFLSEIEVVAFFKNQRTFRLVNDATLTPPWTLIVRAMGHTFSTGQLLAKVHMKSGGIKGGKLIFPVCYVGDSVFQTVKVVNKSDLPCIYQIKLGLEDDFDGSYSVSSDGAVSVKPMSGKISSNGFTLICIKFTPKQCKKYIQVIRCMINGALGGQLLVEGTGALPQLVCSDLLPNYKIGQTLPPNPYSEKIFCLNPICVGLFTRRELILKNSSRLPLRFVCTLPSQYQDVLLINPSSGFLRGNTDMVLTVTFKPYVTSKILCKLLLEAYPIGGTPAKILDARQPGHVSAVEPLTKHKLSLLAEGTIGAVLFDPPELSTDVKLVNTPETMTIILENIADTILQYELSYSMKFTPETGSIITESISYPSQLMRKSHLADKNKADSHQNIFCEEPTGFLPAKSRTKVQFTFQPNRAGLFDFDVSCKIQAIDADGNGILLTNEECVLLYNPSLQRFVNSSPRSLTPRDTETNDETELKIPYQLPLTMKIHGRATFPSLKFEDIRPDGDVLVNDILHLWKQFSLTDINTELHLPLTDDEVFFNTISSPNLSTLKRFKFHFTPNIIGSPCQILSLELKNCGYLTTTFKFNLPNEKELDLEQWCDEDELTEEKLIQISILEELKCFTISPREGILAPGESLILTISYSHTSLKYGGYHKLPVHLKLNQGKQFWIDFIGITLPNEMNSLPPPPPQGGSPTFRPSTNSGAPSAILLFIPNDLSNVYQLASVPIGLPSGEIPLQRIEIFNVSGVDVVYDIDLGTLRQLNKENFDHEIFKVLNPKGIIPMRSSIFIECLFHPISAKSYSLNMSIKYYPQSMDTVAPSAQSRRKSLRDGTGYFHSIKYLQFSICGLGYDTRLSRPPNPNELLIGGMPPTKRLLSIPTVCSLSEDYVSFGLVPKCLECTRMVVLKNNHPSQDVEFSIDETSSYLHDIGILSVIPDRGIIASQDIVVLKLKLLANCQPLIVNNRLKIITSTLFKATTKRNVGSRHDKLKDRIKSRSRVGTASRPDIVESQTFSRSQYMNNMTFTDQGRVATYPSSSVTVSRSETRQASRANGGPPGTPCVSVGPSDTSFSMFSRSGTTPASSMLENGSESSVRGMLKGPMEVLILRLEGEIYSVEVISDLFEKGPQRGILDEFVAPVKMPFIPPRAPTSTTPSSPYQLGLASGTNRMNMTQGLSARSTSPTGSEDSKQTIKSRPVAVSERQYEVRDVVNLVLTNIFKDVLNSRDTKEQLTRAITKPVRGLSFDRATMKPVGGSVYGVYFQEVVPTLGLSFKLINEVKFANCPLTGEGHSDLKILKNDFKTLLLHHFGFTRKSQTFKEILSIMESTRTDSILFRDIIPSLSDTASNVLEKKLDSLAADRTLKSKLSRKGSSSKLELSLPSLETNQEEIDQATQQSCSSSMTLSQTTRPTFFGNLNGGSLASNPAFQSQNNIPDIKNNSSTSAISAATLSKTNKPSLGLRQRTVAMLDNPKLDNLENMTEAAKKIQNLARGTRDRTLAQQRKEDILNSRAVTALAQSEFVSIASNILCDTMFNLMQEVLYGEYIIDAEPIKFMMKEEVSAHDADGERGES